LEGERLAPRGEGRPEARCITNAATISGPKPIRSAIRLDSRMMMPKPVRPPPVMAPSSVWVKPYCSAHWPRIPPRIANPTPAARIAMKPAHKSREALGTTPAGDE